MTAHVIKREYENGIKLKSPIYWCGKEGLMHEWAFTSAQHLALYVETSVGGSIEPCQACIKEIVAILNSEIIKE